MIGHLDSAKFDIFEIIMAKVLTTLRTHWKKSIFFSGVAVYGGNWAKKKYDNNILMKEFCKEALKYGQMTHEMANAPMYNVTVILNPAANKGEGKSRFEDYCAPLLHLAGMKVSVIRTEGEGQAKDVMEIMKDADAVLVAGGDGTLMEAITGAMRREDSETFRKLLPIGVLPVGKNNRLAKSLFPFAAENEVALMANATMAVIRHLFRPMDIIEVKNLTTDEQFAGKKIYGMTEIQLGAFRDAHSRLEKYWFFARLKKLMAYVFAFTTAQSEILWNVPCEIEESILKVKEETDSNVQPEPAPQNTSWLSYFTPSIFGLRGSKQPSTVQTDGPEVTQEWQVLDKYNSIEVSIKSPNASPLKNEESDHILELCVGPEEMQFTDFATEGWNRELETAEKNPAWQCHKSKAFRFKPDESYFSGKEHFFNLDNEPIEVMGPIEVTLLQDKILMFCPKETYVPANLQSETPRDADRKWWQRTGRTVASSQVMRQTRNM